MKTNTTAPSSFLPLFNESRQDTAYWEELAVLGFTEAVLKRLACIGLSKKALAQKMHVSPSHVTKLIGGSNNFTLRTMVKMSMAVDCEMDIKLRPSHCNSNWQSYTATTPHKIIAFSGPCVVKGGFSSNCKAKAKPEIHATRPLAA